MNKISLSPICRFIDSEKVQLKQVMEDRTSHHRRVDGCEAFDGYIVVNRIWCGILKVSRMPCLVVRRKVMVLKMLSLFLSGRYCNTEKSIKLWASNPWNFDSCEIELPSGGSFACLHHR